MAGPYEGKYFDGKTAANRKLRVELAAQGLLVAIEGSRQSELWLYRELLPPERLPGLAGTRVTSRQAPEAQIVVEDPAFWAELTRLLPGFGARLGWRRHKGEVALVVAIVLTVGGAIWAIPHFSHGLAQAMPAAWDGRLGQVVERQMVGHRRVCDEAAGRAALAAMLAALPYRRRYGGAVSLKVIELPMVNAFAAPGGHILIMSGLIDKAETPDEVAGVLAHELGHVIEHHPTAATIRAFGVMSLLDMVMGDSSTVLESVGKGGGMLLLFAHSRADEAAADAIGLELLREAGIDSAGLADFFARLSKGKARAVAADAGAAKKEEGASSEEKTAEAGGTAEKQDAGVNLLAYLNTHPMTAERMRLARAQAGQGRRPALNAEEWQALKAICGPPEPVAEPAPTD